MPKAKLIQRPVDNPDWRGPGNFEKAVKLMLPFYKSRRGDYYHRVRSATDHWQRGKYSHTSIEFWCGAHGSMPRKGTLSQDVPEGAVACAICEGKAIGAGEDGAREINGRPVMFSPRRKVKIEIDIEGDYE